MQLLRLGQVGYIYIRLVCLVRDPLINPRQVRQSQTEFYRHREGKIHASYILQNPGQVTRSAPERAPNGTLRATSYARWDFGAYLTCTPSTRGIICWTFWLHGPFYRSATFWLCWDPNSGPFACKTGVLPTTLPSATCFDFAIQITIATAHAAIC